MSTHAFRRHTFSLVTLIAILASGAMLAVSGAARADPPGRIGRIGDLAGAVSFSPAGENDWVQAAINRPLTSGDRLWTDHDGRAEIQLGGAVMRMGAVTSVAILNLDDGITQVQLTQGSLNVRVRRLDAGQVFEVDTPNLALTLRQPGAYRIDVDADGNASTVAMRQGQGEAYGDAAAWLIAPRETYRFMGTGLRDYQQIDAPRADAFDRWSDDRDRRTAASTSARYVSPDVIGYQDLDDNGTWRNDATYGNVWVPSHVAAGWTPYRDGHWSWVDPWGWTWVDDAPWGFAVSHYGRWTNLRGTWGWVPGPARVRAMYAPALVVFVGGGGDARNGAGAGVGSGVAWFPLAPREVYRPAYPVSRGYFENINNSNTVINKTVLKQTVINNTYTNNVTNVTNVTKVTNNVVYLNRQVPGAVIAVPTTTFVQSQPVARAMQPVPRERMVGGTLLAAPPVAPIEKSVHGAAAQGGAPPPRAFERPVVGRSAPPAPRPGFAAQQQQLSSTPGHPLDDAARKALKPAPASATVPPAPVVRVVPPAHEAAPIARPPQIAPQIAPNARPGDVRPIAKPADGKPAIAPAPSPAVVPPRPVAPGAAPAPVPMPATPLPAPAAHPAPPQHGKDEPRGPATSAPVAPQAGPAAHAAPAPTEQHGKPEQHIPTAPAAAPTAKPPLPAPAPQIAPIAPITTPHRAPEPDRGAPKVIAPVAPKPEPKIEPKPAPHPEPKVEPKPAPQPAPKAEPKPAPRPEPRVEPKPKAAPVARPVEPHAPAAAPAAAPSVAPIAAPKPQPEHPQAQPRGPDVHAAPGKPGEAKKSPEEIRREEEDRKKKE